MKLPTTILAVLRHNLVPFADIDLFVIGLATALWISGIIQARKRGLSRKLQVLFTIVMLGGATGDILIQQIIHKKITITYAVSLILWLGALAVGGFRLLRRKLVLTYMVFVAGVSLVYFSFFFRARLGELPFYALLALGLLLFLWALFLARRGLLEKRGMEKA